MPRASAISAAPLRYQTDFPNQGTAFNIGTVIDFSEHHHLLFSAGRSIGGPVDFKCCLA